MRCPKLLMKRAVSGAEIDTVMATQRERCTCSQGTMAELDGKAEGISSHSAKNAGFGEIERISGRFSMAY